MELSDKDKRRLKLKSDLTKIRQKPEFRQRKNPGSKNKNIKHSKRFYEEQQQENED